MADNKRHYWLYVLKLEHGKYYVGITTKTPEERYREHVMNIRAAGWTRLHKPLKLFDKEDLGIVSKELVETREDKVTLAYMRKYGINNVRGGKYSETEDYVINKGDFYRKDVWKLRRVALRVVVVLMVLLCVVSALLIKVLRSQG